MSKNNINKELSKLINKSVIESGINELKHLAEISSRSGCFYCSGDCNMIEKKMMYKIESVNLEDKIIEQIDNTKNETDYLDCDEFGRYIETECDISGSYKVFKKFADPNDYKLFKAGLEIKCKMIEKKMAYKINIEDFFNEFKVNRLLKTGSFEITKFIDNDIKAWFDFELIKQDEKFAIYKLKLIDCELF